MSNTLEVTLEGSNQRLSVDLSTLPSVVWWDGIQGKPDGKVFGGVITPDSEAPFTPNKDVYYVAFEAGVYDFGFVLNEGEVAYVWWSGSVWSNTIVSIPIDQTPTEGSTNPVESGGVYDALKLKVNVIKVFGIQNLTSEQVNSLRAGDVVVDTLKKTKKAYTVSIQNAGNVDLVMVSYSTLIVCRYRGGVYQNTVEIDIAQKTSEFTNGNVVSFDERGDLYDSGIASSEVATQSDLAGKQDTISDLADIRSGAALGATALQTETDPTVPSWAKQQNKPSYDYSEIGNTPDLSGFITNTVNNLTNYYLKSETYTQAEVNALIGAIQQFHYEIYATLPQTGQSNVLYLIGPTGSGADKYEEYVYANNDFTKIGDTSIDLSGYVTTSALNTALADYTTTANLTTLLSNKADKVANAISGNFAGLDSNGNLTDSGYAPSDFATAAQGALADTAYQKPSTGIPASDLASGVIPDVSGKEDSSNKVTSFQTTPDDTHYPSEKLVKDYVDGICGDIQTILISI